MNPADIRWIDLEHHDDDRGKLGVLEGQTFPFEVNRIFYIHGVPAGTERGGHAHKYEQQCLITLAGRFTLDVSDGARTESFVLDDPNRALYVPPMKWVRLHHFEPGTVVLVLSDMQWNAQHLIRNWDEFRRLIHTPSPTA